MLLNLLSLNKLYQLIINCQGEIVDEISDLLIEVGVEYMEIIPADDQEIFSEGIEDIVFWKNSQLIVYPIELKKSKQIEKRLLIQYPQIKKQHFNLVEYQKKEKESFKNHFSAMNFNDTLMIIPEWDIPKSNNKQIQLTQQDKNSNQKSLILNPGLAFGTGQHPTTFLCLDYLSQLDLNNKTLIDYGCGSGILAIAANLLGAQCYAVDVDKQALMATQNNCDLNQCQLEISFPQKIITLKADFVIANILLNTLTQLKNELYHHLAPNGRLFISGILNHQFEQIKQEYLSLNLKLLNTHQKDRWIALEYAN